MRLLLVEDATDLAGSVLRFLRGEGHAVDHAADAAGAEAALAVGDYACVILDLGLPGGIPGEMVEDFLAPAEPAAE